MKGSPYLDGRQGLLPGFQPAPLRKPRGYLLKQDDLYLIIGLPWLTFTVSSMAVGMASQGIRLLTYAVAVVFFLNAMVFLCIGMSLGQTSPRERRASTGYTYVGLLCIIALAAGWSLGLLADYCYMDEYWRITHGATHRDVIASGLGATSYDDASVLEFQKNTFIDTQRTVGYMHRGQVYCAAPVTSQAFTNSPLYYAVGKDCCDQRGNFRCSKAEPEPGKRLMAVSVDADEDAHYQDAIRMGSSVYEMKLGAKRIAMKFVSDHGAHLGNLWHGAFISLLCASIVYGAISAMTGFCLRKLLRDGPPRDSVY